MTMETASSAQRAVSLDEAMSMAIFFQKNGQLEDAQGIYRKVLELVPDHVDALHYCGVLAHQMGDSDAGVALIEQSLTIEPNQADCHSNLGIIHKARGDLDKAVAAYQQAIALNPQHANAYNNLGVLFKAQRKAAEAEQAYRTAIRLNSENADAYHNLGSLLVSTNRVQEAVVCFCMATTLSPQHAEARRLLAMAYCTIGERGKAIEIFQRWLADEPDNLVAQHMLAACSGENVPLRAADAYVEKIFDDFASSFDTKLANLAYRAPELVAAMLADSGTKPAKNLVILDAGCGTGLCGPLVASYARQLVGVDLSSGMLAKAADKNAYDELIQCELTAYLNEHKEAYDVIVCADTLCYFGALEAAFAAASAALRTGGMFIFSLEEAIRADATFTIETHGRYSHARFYVERELAKVGLHAEIVHAELRMEAGAPVKGLVVRATKEASVGMTIGPDAARTGQPPDVAHHAGETNV
jgi:predicted TPR repeat methyltransferase